MNKVWTKEEIERYKKFEESFNKWFQWIHEHPEIIASYYDRFVDVRDVEIGHPAIKDELVAMADKARECLWEGKLFGVYGSPEEDNND